MRQPLKMEIPVQVMAKDSNKLAGGKSVAENIIG